jgi:putative membrane protein
VIITTASTAPCRREFQNDRIVQALLGCYVIVWIVLAVSPVDRKDWLLENLLAMTLGLTLVGTYRTFAFSDLSYILITVFMTLHAIGAHYTYSKVPLGFWLKDAFDLSRNHFDRIVHFAFGLLLAYPIRELLLRTAHVRGFWSYYLPVSATLALSGLFEVIESWVAQIVSPELGDAYLGTQGDVWDAQKDMTAAFIGALIAILLTLTIPKIPPPRLNPPAQ